MLYVMTLSWQPGLTPEQRDGALARRAQWQYPDGLTVLGEYWTAAENPALVAVFEAENFSPFMDIGLTWGDVFQINTYPAVTAEEGMKLGLAAMERRGA
ncbi:DUF3303 domain-containing protein [Kitasatospora sp. KL5]|uniref:DUF3303 domain-containing protein n=1 Tax=Kitasatospora sp. KL5 TaxID=3425125 RepID=UPI003D701380